MNPIPTILYVDDDENDVLLLRHALRCAKQSVDLKIVNDPEKASAYLEGRDGYADRESHPFPSLVLLDLKMPRMHGLEVLNWIRRHPKLKRLVVIVFTASNHGVEVNRAYEMGANSYLVKPVELGALVEMIKLMGSYWMTVNVKPTY